MDKKYLLFSLMLLISVGLASAFTTSDCALGGNVSINGNKCVHVFTSNSSFNVTQNITGAEILVVAGGGAGGGGGNNYAGGGGAGGLVYNSSANLSIGNYSIYIGRGGGACEQRGENGGNSSFNNQITAVGGAGGNIMNNGSFAGGGCGGGGVGGFMASSHSIQGNYGGIGYGYAGGGQTTQPNAGGGGGGAGSGGVNITVGDKGTDGGMGMSFTIFNGTPINYSCGGGGGGGAGGRGYGGCSYGGNGYAPYGGGGGTVGVDGTGSGGGGGSGGAGSFGASGGSGIVIISYEPSGTNYNIVNTYTSPILEGTPTTISLNITIPSNATFQSAYLVYGGVAYLGSFTNNGYVYTVTRDITTPFINSDTNITFYWSLNLGYNYNSSALNQTIKDIAMDNCSVYTNKIYNFSIRDEDTQLILNSTNNVYLHITVRIAPYGTKNPFLNFSTTFINQTYDAICLNIPLNSSLYSAYITADYGADLHVQKFYFADNETITGSNTPQNISLYSLLSTESTTFLFSYADSYGNLVPNAIIQVWRYYIGDGTYRLVETGRQDSNGFTALHLTEEDVIYYFSVYLNGQWLYVSPTYTAKCVTTPCSLSINQEQSFTPFDVDWELFNGSYFSLNENSTDRIVTLYFISPDLATMNLTIFKYYNGNIQVVNSSTLTATAGSLSLHVPNGYGNTIFFATIYKNNNAVRTEWINFQQSARIIFGVDGVVMAMFIIIALVMMALSEGWLLVVVAVIGLILCAVMFLIDLSWMALISIIGGAGLLIWRLIIRRK